MIKKVFYNSSLPRAGSTLFQNIVGQNPDFYVTPTSGLNDLIHVARDTYSGSQAFLAQDSKLMSEAFFNFCRKGIEGFFEPLTEKPYVLDKSRGWGINYNLLDKFYPDPKIVCMVRDIRSIYSSMEKNFRKNPHKNSGIQNPGELVGTTLNKRIDIWGQGHPVGITMDRLLDITQQGIDKKILFIRYEDLMSNPMEEMKRFYDYLGVDFYNGHDFNHIDQLTHENDAIHGIYGDHKLRKEFKRLPDDYDEVLGYEICQNIKKHYQWFFDYFGYV